MNIKFLPLLLILFAACQQNVPQNEELFFVGSYTQKEGHVDGKSKGIALCSFDSETGKVTNLGVKAETLNPSFVAVHPSGKYLYAVNETGGAAEKAFGRLVSYQIDPETFDLKEINTVTSGGKYPCHISVSEGENYLFAANYGGGVSMHIIHPDGRLSEKYTAAVHEGKGTHARQEASHIHMAVAKDEQVFVSDLGTDVLAVYGIDKTANALKLNQEIEIPEASGPRHFTFSENGEHIYLVNELNATINLIKKDSTNTWQVSETYPTLASKATDGACADIHLSRNGKFLYASNRGQHNSISLFAVDKITGELTFVEETSTEGKHPRNFALSANGKFLLAANQDSSNISIFRIDAATGKLSFQESFKIETPVCIAFL